MTTAMHLRFVKKSALLAMGNGLSQEKKRQYNFLVILRELGYIFRDLFPTFFLLKLWYLYIHKSLFDQSSKFTPHNNLSFRILMPPPTLHICPISWAGKDQNLSFVAFSVACCPALMGSSLKLAITAARPISRPLFVNFLCKVLPKSISSFRLSSCYVGH